MGKFLGGSGRHRKHEPNVWRRSSLSATDLRDQTLNICGHHGHAPGLNFDYQSGSIEALVNLVKQGVGYTLVPELAVKQCNFKGQIRRFQTPEPVREVSLVVHNSFAKEALIDSMRTEILANIPKSMLSKKRYLRVNWR